MSALIECVPNFSEGRNPEVIRRITDRIASVDGATLLHVDPGKATNRTVVTIAGAPDAVVTTVRLVALPGSTCSSVAPSTDPIRSVMRRMTSGSRPSLKLGTHSIRADMGSAWEEVAAI